MPDPVGTAAFTPALVRGREPQPTMSPIPPSALVRPTSGGPASGEEDSAGAEGEPSAERDRVQEASEESFPASDAPGWQSPLHFGAPDRHAAADLRE